MERDLAYGVTQGASQEERRFQEYDRDERVHLAWRSR